MRLHVSPGYQFLLYQGYGSLGVGGLGGFFPGAGQKAAKRGKADDWKCCPTRYPSLSKALQAFLSLQT